ncbi:DUF2125 domain-containing protein [Roseovarius indicus]|uniref:DUF2125 domain-containing protein n=1 Tax=Roseovarius indicus TaxID=540747 RepID=UPI0007D95A73|nr:DUF2125 domain-containing protein [Roseovarius indicus]OAN99262.1 hypothetical protein A8B76_14805 [Roseovarius indicus]
MRILLTLIVIAAAAWSGYWYIGKTGVSEGFSTWLEARRAEGWAAETGTLETVGYPNRFDTTFTDITLADPDTGLAWEAPFFQILALSYKPNHVIAVWPDEQLVATPREKYQVTSSDMRASVVVGADLDLPLERTTLTAEELAVTPVSEDQTTRAEALRLAAERLPAHPATYRLGLAADGLSPALEWRVRLDPAGKLPERFDAFEADVTVEFDKPWDRSAIEEARPQPRRIELRLAQARWGELELQAAGEVTVDAQGYPEGEVTVKARNWRDILKMAVASGTLPDAFAGTLEDGLGLISQMSGNPKTLDIPLNFRNGKVRLGPVPLGDAPVLRLR